MREYASNTEILGYLHARIFAAFSFRRLFLWSPGARRHLFSAGRALAAQYNCYNDESKRFKKKIGKIGITTVTGYK